MKYLPKFLPACLLSCLSFSALAGEATGIVTEVGITSDRTNPGFIKLDSEDLSTFCKEDRDLIYRAFSVKGEILTDIFKTSYLHNKPVKITYSDSNCGVFEAKLITIPVPPPAPTSTPRPTPTPVPPPEDF